MLMHFLAPVRRNQSPDRRAPIDDLLYFSDRRWDQISPGCQQLLARAAITRRVLLVEPPLADGVHSFVETRLDATGVIVVAPHIPPGGAPDVHARVLLDFVLSTKAVRRFSCWYETPGALKFSAHLSPRAVVYDGTDQETAPSNGPVCLTESDSKLLSRADLVLSGCGCVDAARARHANVLETLSSKDRQHFARARGMVEEPADQRAIAHPRIGVLGEPGCLDHDFLMAAARLVPGWHFVVLAAAPLRTSRNEHVAPNVHWLGPRPYAALPEYFSGWDVAMSPSVPDTAGARGLATTLQFLAAGIPVVSTPIAALEPLREAEGLARMADSPGGAVVAVREALSELSAAWLARADAFLASQAWDLTWSQIGVALDAIIASREPRRHPQFRSPQAGPAWPLRRR